MTGFAKAFLEEVTDKPVANPERDGVRVEVQINPATLRLQMASTVDAGKDADRQKTQAQAATSTLSFDLVFDTADEAKPNGDPVDVRDRTRQLERFVLPRMKSAKAAPPRVRFTYGTFSVVGVMTSLNQDFDLFSVGGTPLRAKCAVTIREQKPEFDAKLAGPGANRGLGAIPPVPAGSASSAGSGGSPGPLGSGAPGGSGGPGAFGGPGGGVADPRATDRTGAALAGETAAGFADRMGLDPRAWWRYGNPAEGSHGARSGTRSCRSGRRLTPW